MKKISLAIFILILFTATTVFASTEVTMQIVENNVCTINLNESSVFEKKIIDSNLENHEVTLQLKVTNNSEVIIPTGELILVIDSSESMNEIVEGDTTRRDLVLESANKLVENLLKVNPSSLNIGVVTFSTGSEKDNDGYLITGTENDAQKVCDFTNDLSLLKEKISTIEGTGQYTNLDAGLQLAKSQFSSENNNKYLVVLTDGLPNLAVGYNDLVSYNGLTEVINQTKSTLQSLTDVNVITMLTGISNEEANFRVEGENSYTYGQVIEAVFGNKDFPTNGKFYNVDDTEINETITQEIYNNLLPIQNTIKNLTILDYFPEYISNNFSIKIHDDSKSEVATLNTNNENVQYISWKIDELSPKETKTLKYTISLKDEFDESIISKILNTNEKVDISYDDFDGTNKTETSNVSPKIKLTAVPEPEPPKDETIVETPIPSAGSPIYISIFVILVCFAIFFKFMSREIK